MAKFTLQDAAGVAHDVEVSSSPKEQVQTVRASGKSHQVDLRGAADGPQLLVRHGQVETFHAVLIERTVHVWIQGRIYVFERIDRNRARPKRVDAAREDLVAPMPGTVLKINFAPGQTYEAHEAIIVMESMKMELTLSSPAPGQISEVFCAVGELVPLDKILARLKPVSDA